MKKLIIYSLCIIMFLQSGIGSNAQEIGYQLEQIKEEQQQEVEEPAAEEKRQQEVEEPAAEEEQQQEVEEPTPEEEQQQEVEESAAEEEQKQEVEEPAAEEEQKQEVEEPAAEEEQQQEVEESAAEEEQKQEVEVPMAEEEQQHEIEVSENAEKQQQKVEASTEERQKEEKDWAVEADLENDDPQFGRENGCIDEKFYGIQLFSSGELDYVHNEKFNDYVISDVIDVSKYQGTINWTKVKSSGIDYAFIRAGFRGYGTSGSLNTDANFESNMVAANKAGLEVGVYFFSQAITEAEAVVEAEYVLDLIKGYEVSLPVVIDFEYASSNEGLTGRLYNANLSVAEATEICKAFCATIEENGHEAMVYANKDMLENGLNSSEIAETYKIWLANYTTHTSYEGDYEFWQYTQSGIVDGISGNVDKSFWYEKKRVVEYAEIQEGIYKINSCLNTNKVIDIPGGSFASGINAQIYTGNDTWAQKFYIRPEGENTYIIMSANSGKVLESDGNSVYQKGYTGTTKQQWRFVENSDGSYSIESVEFPKVVSLANGSGENKTTIQLKKDRERIAQCFQLTIESERVAHNIQDGVFLIETALSEDQMLNLKADGENLEIRILTNATTQKIQFEYVGNGCYRLISVLNQKVLSSGSGAQLYFSNNAGDSTSQKWIIKKNTTGTYTIISAEDGKNLDIVGAKNANGTSVQRYVGNGTLAQQFKLHEAQVEDVVLENGIYIIHSALNDSKVLDVAAASKKSDANIQLYSCNRTAAQKFEVKQQEDGNYSICSYNSGMAIAAKDGKNDNKTNVLQTFPTGGNGQKWKITSAGKGYFNILTANGEKSVDIAGGKSTNGTNVQIYTCNGTRSQKFRFEKVGEIDNSFAKIVEDGTYTICSALNESKALDVAGASLYSGANVQLYTSNNTSVQHFVVKKDSNSDLYTIISKKSGMKVTYKDGSLKNSTNVFQDTALSDVGTHWKFKHIVDDYYMLYAANSDYCMDVAGAKSSNGTNIQIYKSNGSKAQIFKLKKVSSNLSTEQNSCKQLDEGLYTISTELKSSLLLDVASASKKDGANIQLYQSNNNWAQKFVVQKLTNGNYTIKALCSDKLISMNGTNVCQQTDTGLASQQWEIISAGNGYYTIKSATSRKVMDVAGAKANNNTNIQVYTSNYTKAQRFKFTQTITTPNAKFVSDGKGGYKVNYEVYAKGNEKSADDYYYLMQADCYSGKIYGSPLMSVEKDYSISMEVEVSDRSKLKELAMDKLVLTIRLSNGLYQAVSNPVSILNPETIASNKEDIFKASSKKGLQGVAYASSGKQPVDARYANTKQTLINLDLATVVNPTSDYTTFTYKGKEYKFSNCSELKANIQSLNSGYKQYLYGNDGITEVAVTLCVLLSYNSNNSYLIDPAARTKGHSYYMLNVREQNARETLEAVFVYLGEILGKENCYVTNWILGNEINSSKAWNYSGSLSFDNYMQCYATAFRMLYNAVKTEKSGNTVCVSLDNGWTAVPDTYAGKITLDTFAKKINEENPDIAWSIAYHAYSYPLTRVDFWNDSSNTSNSVSTKYISMKNITVLTNYMAELEKAYKKTTGSIRVLLTEQGYSFSGGAETQAIAIARGYYIAEFNNRIDAFIIRSIVDDAEEAKGKLYFGLMNSLQDKRIAFYVYEYMDSNLAAFANTPAQNTVSTVNYTKFNSAKNILCNTNWKSIVPGFDSLKLAEIK